MIYNCKSWNCKERVRNTENYVLQILASVSNLKFIKLCKVLVRTNSLINNFFVTIIFLRNTNSVYPFLYFFCFSVFNKKIISNLIFKLI